VGIYGSYVLPRLIDVACGPKSTGPRRERVCAGLRGSIVEIGFGSGINVPYYPTGVEWVAAVEPADVAWRLAADRVAASPVTIERVGLDGAQVPLDDASCDAALSTWTMCTIADIEGALAELRRVVKPGGTLHFVEHGLAPDRDAKVQRLQHRLDPLQQRLFGGCHLTRRIADLITGAGFVITEVDVFYEPKSPKFLAADTLGVATSPAG
jgi:SAM-dependent methyltransferase